VIEFDVLVGIVIVDGDGSLDGVVPPLETEFVLRCVSIVTNPESVFCLDPDVLGIGSPSETIRASLADAVLVKVNVRDV